MAFPTLNRLLLRLLPAVALAAAAGLVPNPQAFASKSCVGARIDKPAGDGQLEGTMSRIPVMSQGSTDTCYAFVAAQMADAFRFSRPGADKNHLTAPLAVAVDYANTFNSRSVNGGSVGESLKLIFKHGSCSYEKVGDRLNSYSLDGFLNGLEIYYDDARVNGVTDRNLGGLSCFLETRDFSPELFDIASLNKLLKRDSFLSFLYGAVVKVCNDDNIVAIPEPHPVPFTLLGADIPNPDNRVEAFKAVMDTVDNPRALPVAVNFCKELLFDPDFRGIKKNGQRTDRCSNHSAILVGRRLKSDGTCQVLLRNSFGVNFGSKWKSDERGQVWVDENALFPNMTGTVSLQ